MSRLDNSIEACRIAAETLEQSLSELLCDVEPISETMLSELWLKKLREHTRIYPDGWYTPPPHGMFVQLATDTNPERVNKVTNRPPEAWPRSDIFLDRKNGLISAYASPVDKSTGLIGDFSISLYFGNNPDIQQLLKQTLDMDIHLFKSLEVGIEYATIAQYCDEYMAEHQMYNDVVSSSDQAGSNIGHTVPGAENGWDEAERKIFEAGNWEAIAELISSKRIFINTTEHSHIAPTSAHTIEPRPMVIGRPDLPMVNFHTMVVWQDGQKQFVTFFDKLFHLAGMDYMFDEVTSPFLNNFLNKNTKS